MCLSYRISRGRSGCSQLQENVAQKGGGGSGVKQSFGHCIGLNVCSSEGQSFSVELG